MPTADREGLGPVDARDLANELMTYADQLLRAEAQAGMGGKDLAVRVKEPGELALLMTRAASALKAETAAQAVAERDKARAKSMPHMCRDGHPEIRHADSGEDERCPVCRERDRADFAEDRIARLSAEAEALREVLKRIGEGEPR